MEACNLVAFVEKVVVESENARDDGEGVEDAGFVEEGVDTVRVSTLCGCELDGKGDDTGWTLRTSNGFLPVRAFGAVILSISSSAAVTSSGESKEGNSM